MALCAQADVDYQSRDYNSPLKFESDIERFEKAAAANPPPKGAVVCIGSSSMLGWRDTIESDLAPITVIPRGFGGSNTNDALHYADRIVLPYQPRAIIFYEGENDIAQGIPPQQVAETFKAFVDKIHAELPACRLYFLSIKPSIQRQQLWPAMQEANAMIQKFCSQDPRLTYVDVASGMFDEEGGLKLDIFKKDNLHMNRKGYIIWREKLMPYLLEGEIAKEQTLE